MLTTPPRSLATTKGGVRFPETSWDLLSFAARTEKGEHANAAALEFTERYYSPVRAYIAAIVRNPDEFDDLTQRFFLTAVLSGRILASADPARGSFRAYLKRAIRNFLVDEHRRRTRSGDGVRAEIHPDGTDGGWELVADGAVDPGTVFDRAWARAIVKLALEVTDQVCAEKGQQQHFELFAGRFLTESDKVRSWRDLGAAFGLDEKTARTRAETAARRFRAEVRRLVSTELGVAGDPDAEIRALIALF